MSTMAVTTTEVFELQPPSKAAVRDPSRQQFPTSQRPSNSIPDACDVESFPLQPQTTTNLRLFFIIFTPSLVGFFASFTNGVITVGLPIIARSISLERSLYLWPSSVYGLTSGAALLIAGSIADIVGARSVELVGITLLGLFTLLCGFAHTGAQLVVFRALQGVALAMHLPASVSIIAGAVPSGRARNLGFACLGFSQPLGFAIGLVLSGVMIERAGWRSGFYLAGGCTLAVAIAALWALPKLKPHNEDGVVALWQKVGREIDWIGGLISSGGLAMLAYVLAFQEVQHASTLTTSLYLLPNLMIGVLINIFVGMFVHRVSVRWLVTGSALICALSPMFMAIVPPAWSYWKLVFWAQLFAPFSADVLFTVGLIIVSNNFPEKTQALAGAVFNTVAQFGMSLGMGSCQVVALGIQDKEGGNASSSGHGDDSGAFEGHDPTAVLKGYRASYWLMFSYMIVCIFIAVVGLRKAGKVGLKRE
ncbi:Nn.00g003820.m01.CDS01 [Neocucurbitaria sp. VM-36]